MQPVTLEAGYIINGSFGELTDLTESKFRAEAQQVTFRVVNEKKPWKGCGSSRTAYKRTGSAGDGTISQFHISSEALIEVGLPMWDPNKELINKQLMITLDDPEQLGTEQIVLTGVKFWEWSGGWQVNEVVMENIVYTFSSIWIPMQVKPDAMMFDFAELTRRFQIQHNL